MVETKNRFKITIEYDGTNFHGWQKQPALPSIQASIEDAIGKFTQEKVVLHVAGRTDAGVHAFAQVAHFDLKKDFDPQKIIPAINHHVGDRSISIICCEKMDDSFHARYSAKKRFYTYKILNRKFPPALDKKRVWFVPINLDIDKMCQAAKYLIGKHDFTSFRDSECQANSPIRTIDYINIYEEEDLILIHVSAKSFLHHMVRNIVGTLKLAGAGKIEPEKIIEILNDKNRCSAGPTAPACGLYFVKVDY